MNCKWFIFSIILFLSCQNKEPLSTIPIIPIDMDDAQSISYTELSTGEYMLSYPEAMLIDSGNLIVQDRRGQSHLFHLINKEDHYSAFVPYGNGPGEYLDTGLNPFQKQENIIGFYDFSHKKVLFYERTINGTYQWKSELGLHKSFGQEYVREVISCGRYYVAMGLHGIFDDYRFAVLDEDGKLLKGVGHYPSLSPSLLVNPQKDMEQILFPVFFKVSPDKKKAVCASYKASLIHFFDLSSLPDSLIEVNSFMCTVPIKKEQINVKHDGWVYGFEDAYVTNENVYLVFNGQTSLDNPLLGRKILKYDWNGNLQKKYLLDIGIRSLAINGNDLYFIGYKDEEFKLYTGRFS